MQNKTAETAEPTPNALAILRELGLTSAAARCYQHLAHRLPCGVRSTYILRELAMPPSSIFRGLNELTSKGFARRSKITHTSTYWAIPLTHALDNYAEYQRRLARPLIAEQRNREPID